MKITHVSVDGDWIKQQYEKRIGREATWAEIAQAAWIHPKTMERIRKNEGSTSAKSLVKLCTLLHCRIWDFVRVEWERKPLQH